MSSKQCFACLSYLQSNEITKRASTLINFHTEIKDLLRNDGRLKDDKDYQQDKERQELVENLSVCSKCLDPIKLVVSSKCKVDRVESRVRKLQVDLLKELNKLEKCLEVLWGDLEVIGGIILESSGDGDSQIAYDNGLTLTEDALNFRKDILDVKGQLQLFRNGIRNSTTSTTANNPDNQNKSSNSNEILPPPPPLQTSVKIKTEPDTKSLIPNHFDDPDLMEHDYYFDSLPSDTEACEDTPLPMLPTADPDNSPGPSKSIKVTKLKYSKVLNKCPQCSQIFKLKSALQYHQKIYHPNERLQEILSCPHCHQTMARQFLRTHKLYHCPILKKNKPATFPCTICKVEFENVDLLKKHNLESHIEKLKNMCETCGKISVSRPANEMHQNTHKDPRSRQVVECEDCGKLILATSIDSHRRLGCSKRENSSFLCKFCHKYFCNESYVEKHILKMHKGYEMDKPMGHRRNIQVIAEEDNLDDEVDKPDDKEEVNKEDDSGSEFIPSDDEVEEQMRRRFQRGRRRRPRAPIQCPKCPRTFTWKLALKKHKIADHRNDWLSESTHCPHCLETMPRKLLRTHQYYHCPVKPKDIIYSCTLCQPSLDAESEPQHPTFPDLQSLKSHVASQHPRKMLALICDICGLISKSTGSHDKHQVRHVHPKERAFVDCDDCGKSILSTSISSHKRLGCPKREKTTFPCVYCTKKFSTEMAVVRHVNDWHTGPNGELIVKGRRPLKLQCHLCGKWIQDKAAMRRHLKSGHQKWEERDKIVCEFCGKEMLAENLGNHEKYYCGGKERGEGEMEAITCEICGKGFKSHGILQRHKKVVHDGAEKFVCEICGKVFPSKRNYKSHLERHRGIRRFGCELGCGARFKQKVHLQKHMRLNYCRGEKGPRKQRRSDLEIVGKEVKIGTRE